MTEGTAIEFARRKMHELGVGDNYTLRYRKIQIPPIRKVELEAFNELIIVIKPSYHLKVYSKAGILNLRDKKINEHQYLHRGKTWLINQSGKYHINATILQVIPTLDLKQ
jgi:hypothetical protein